MLQPPGPPCQAGAQMVEDSMPPAGRTPMIDLKPAYLKKVKKILSGNVPEYDVLVYGSRADGTAKTYSYLDLAVMSEKPLAPALLGKLAAEFTSAGFPFRVETIDWGSTGGSFRKEIRKTGVLIQQSPRK